MRYPIRRFIQATCFTTVAFVGGCTAEYRAGYGGELVYAAPGVQVVPDGDDPVFYSANYYWRFDGGGWYRSSNYDSWEYATPPVAVSRLDRQRFVHYRPEGWTPTPAPRGGQPQVRDHRDDRVRTTPAAVAPPGREFATPSRAAAPPAARPAPQAHDHRAGESE